MSGDTKRITTSLVSAMSAGDEIWDRELKGFGVRRQVSATTYFVQKRVHGRKKRMTIGRHGSPWTAETARKEASRLLLQIGSGEDPSRMKADLKQTGMTFDEIIDVFLASHGAKLKASTRVEYERLLRGRLLAAFKGKALDDITEAAVARAHSSWSKTPRAANFAVSILSKVMNWSRAHGYRKSRDNPCLDVELYRENRRERYLTHEELVRLGEALTTYEGQRGNPWAVALIRTLLLTGARLNEIRTLKHTYLDMDLHIIRLPDSKTGAKSIPLSQPAIDLIASVPRIEGNPWVFPGHKHGAHIVNVFKIWNEIRTLADIKDVRLHDLRHSFASFAVGAGGSLPLIGKILGHANLTTTERYAHIAPSPALATANATAQIIAEALAVQPKRVFGD